MKLQDMNEKTLKATTDMGIAGKWGLNKQTSAYLQYFNFVPWFVFPEPRRKTRWTKRWLLWLL